MNRPFNIKPCPICLSKTAIHERTINTYDLLKCQACGFVFVNLSDERIKAENAACNDDFSAIQEERQNFIDEMWFKLLADKIKKLVTRGNILDIGCGNGLLLKHFVAPGWTPHGLDFSPWAVKFARIYGYPLTQCELEDADFPDAYFDVITSTSTLEHIAHPPQHVMKILQLLKPGGLAYFAGIPNYGAWSVKLNLCDFYHNIPPKHVNYFTLQTFRHMLASPELLKKTRKISISTYGIPELHRMYYFLRKTTRLLIPKSPQNAHKKSTPEKNLAAHPGFFSGLNQLTAKVIALLYYGLGKPFHAGSKLEAIVIKSDTQ